MQTCDQRRLSRRSGTTSGTRMQPDAVDRFVADDVVIEAGGQEISGKDNVKNWVKEFLDHVNDLHVDTIETFQNEDGTRVTSRWVLTGTNNGILGTEPNGKPDRDDRHRRLDRGTTESCSAAGSSRPRSSSTTGCSRTSGCAVANRPTLGGGGRSRRARHHRCTQRRGRTRGDLHQRRCRRCGGAITAWATPTRTPSLTCRASTWNSTWAWGSGSAFDLVGPRPRRDQCPTVD